MTENQDRRLHSGWAIIVNYALTVLMWALAAAIVDTVWTTLGSLLPGGLHSPPGVRVWAAAVLFVALVARVISKWVREGPAPAETASVSLSGDEDRKHLLTVWERVVDVQMHFNDMVMRIRNFSITLLVAVVGAAGLALRAPAETQGGVPLAPILLLAGLAAWMAFYVLDRWYYHMLLVGAVMKGREIERLAKNEIPYMDLGDWITEYSRIKVRGTGGKGVVRARHKLDFFYLAIGLLLALAFRAFAGGF